MADMTIKQMTAATIAILKGETVEGFDAQDAVEFMEGRLAKLESKGSKPYAPKPQTIENRAAVATHIADMAGEFTAKEVADAIELSTSAVSAALRYFVKDGIVEDRTGENDKVKVYAFIG